MDDTRSELTARSLLSLIFALLAFGPCPCLGPVAAILLGLGETSAVGRAGFWLGWVALGLFFVYLAAGLVLAVLLGGGALLAEAFN